MGCCVAKIFTSLSVSVFFFCFWVSLFSGECSCCCGREQKKLKKGEEEEKKILKFLIVKSDFIKI